VKLSLSAVVIYLAYLCFVNIRYTYFRQVFSLSLFCYHLESYPSITNSSADTTSGR